MDIITIRKIIFQAVQFKLILLHRTYVFICNLVKICIMPSFFICHYKFLFHTYGGGHTADDMKGLFLVLKITSVW
jgi:hypothetical protein